MVFFELQVRLFVLGLGTFNTEFAILCLQRSDLVESGVELTPYVAPLLLLPILRVPRGDIANAAKPMGNGSGSGSGSG